MDLVERSCVVPSFYSREVSSQCIDVTAPIVGATSVEKLEGLLGAWTPSPLNLHFRRSPADCSCVLLGALEVELNPEEVKYLEDAYKPLAIFGHA